MKLDYYSWPPKRKADDTANLPLEIAALPPLSLVDEAQGYIPHPDLQAAVNLALVLGKPLLITGEPGTGKTRLAESVRWQLGLKNLFKFVAKSTSTARDLIYSYDAIGRFYAAEAAGRAAKLESASEVTTRQRDAACPVEFITYAALGEAILRAHEQRPINAFLPPNFAHCGKPERSIVLIDEIDKAPRDFPNDLLNELDLLRFRVPEISDTETPELCDRALRPIIIITSNQERNLPEAFLRRCIYFNIPFPDARGGSDSYSIENIVARRIGQNGTNFVKNAFVQQGIEFFMKARNIRDLDKRPATGELLDWIEALRIMQADASKSLREQPELARASVYALFKGRQDLEKGQAELERWLEGAAR